MTELLSQVRNARTCVVTCDAAIQPTPRNTCLLSCEVCSSELGDSSVTANRSPNVYANGHGVGFISLIRFIVRVTLALVDTYQFNDRARAKTHCDRTKRLLDRVEYFFLVVFYSQLMSLHK